MVEDDDAITERASRQMCSDERLDMNSESAPDRNKILAALSDALARVVNEDPELLTLQAHELSLVHRFGVYLEEALRADIRSLGLSVDLDYNRHGRGQKILPERTDRCGESKFRPDLIVHRRGDDTCNLLVIEWKKQADENTIALLEDRLRVLLAVDGPATYRYETGVLIDSLDSAARWCAWAKAQPGSGHGVAGACCRSPRTHAARSSGGAGSRSGFGPVARGGSCQSIAP